MSPFHSGMNPSTECPVADSPRRGAAKNGLAPGRPRLTPVNEEQLKKIGSADGFIAALDQSGGSTPKALKLYGIDESAYSNDAEMFDVMHQARVRIMTSPVFNGDRVIG